jgi:phage I-like protein
MAKTTLSPKSALTPSPSPAGRGERLAACAFPLAATAGAIQIFPAGEFSVPRGAMQGEGPWRMDQVHAAALISRVAQRSNPLVIDYEHQSLLSRDNGKPAPAAGWIKPGSLEWRADGLYAVGVDWTENAQAMIQAGEYRFLSPVFAYDPATGFPTDLLNVALTNHPAIDGMNPVMLAAASARFPLQETPPMLHAAVKELLGLTAAEPTDTEITAACAALSARLKTADAQDGEIAALKAKAPDPAQYAPVAALSALQTELAALKANALDRDVRDLIEPALTDGRLLPAQEQWARDLGKSNLAALKSYLDTAQPIAALRGSQTGGKPPTGGAAGEMTGEAIAVAASKYQAEQLAAGNPVGDVDAVLHVMTNRS